jgi:hypothetical protein
MGCNGDEEPPPVGDRLHLVPERAEQVRERLAEIGVVLREQDMGAATGVGGDAHLDSLCGLAEAARAKHGKRSLQQSC